jgi:hypothetical protein
MALSDSTLLGLERVGGGFALPEFAARGLTMTMRPIETSSQIERDVNGNLVDLMDGFEQFRKYKGTITCDDTDSPAFALVTTDDDAVWRGNTFMLTCIPHLGSEDAIVLTVMCMDWNITRDEWNAATAWSFDWEQV